MRMLLREKFNKNPDILCDSEIMELIGVKYKTGDESIGKIIDMSKEEMISAGFSENDAIILKGIKEIAQRYLAQRIEKKDVLTSPERVINFARMKIGRFPHEAFMVIFLNTQNEVLGHEIVNEGTVDQVAVYPRRIIEKALSHHAAGLILVHNHPSGHTDPSEEDKRLTSSVKDTCRILDIRVLDHIIVGSSVYFSFLEKGIL